LQRLQGEGAVIPAEIKEIIERRDAQQSRVCLAERAAACERAALTELTRELGQAWAEHNSRVAARVAAGKGKARRDVASEQK
jgi:hypothetical protein